MTYVTCKPDSDIRTLISVSKTREIILADHVYWNTWKWVKINFTIVLLCCLGCKEVTWPAFSLQEKGIYIKLNTFGIWNCDWYKNSRPPIHERLTTPFISHLSLCHPLLSAPRPAPFCSHCWGIRSQVLVCILEGASMLTQLLLGRAPPKLSSSQ